MKNKKFKLVAAATAAVMLIGGVGVISACTDGEDSANGEVYTRVVNSLLDMEDCPFTVMENGMDGTSGIMPYDSWGVSKFTTVKHTFTLQIGTVGFADSDADIKIAMKSDGTVDFATGESKTALASKNLAESTVSSGWGENATTSTFSDTLASCNYMFKLDTYLVGNGLSDGYTGSAHACYVWYGKTGDLLEGEDDGLEAGTKAYSLPVSTYSEYYVDGDLSHGGSTTSIAPDGGFYINSLMNQGVEPYTYAEHHGGTDATLVYVTPKVLGMAYFKSGYIYIDGNKITKFDAQYYSDPFKGNISTDYTVYQGETMLGTNKDGNVVTVNLEKGASVTIKVDTGASMLSSLLVHNTEEAAKDAQSGAQKDTFASDALTIEKASPVGTSEEFTLTAGDTDATVDVVIATDRGTLVTVKLKVVIGNGGETTAE